MISGPRFGYRPEMLLAALTTAAGRAATSASAATLSMSWWSMTATSPAFNRLVRFLVRRSARAGPHTPGPCGGCTDRRAGDILTVRWSHGRRRDHGQARSATPTHLPGPHHDHARDHP